MLCITKPRIYTCLFDGKSASGKICDLFMNILILASVVVIFLEGFSTIAIAFGAVGTCGQRCTSTRRVIVHEKKYNELKNALKNSWKSSVSISPSFSMPSLTFHISSGLPEKSITHLDKHSSIGM